MTDLPSLSRGAIVAASLGLAALAGCDVPNEKAGRKADQAAAAATRLAPGPSLS